MRSFIGFLLTVILGSFCLLPSTLVAQTPAAAQAKLGSVHGQVFDEAGAVIVGATLTLVDAQQAEKTAVTDNTGAFTFTGIAPGTYTLRAGSTGFAAFTRDDVEVTVGRRTEVKITLAVALEDQQVTVTSEPEVSTDPEANAGAIVLRGTDLDALPDDPDELAAALQALAGPSAGPNGGQLDRKSVV